MDTFTAIETRRSIKHYDPDYTIGQDEIDKLMSLAILSPTSFNIQNWRFVLIQNPDLRQQVRAAAWDQAQITDASLLIALCADLNAWAKETKRYWKNADPPVRDQLLPMIDQFDRGHEQLQRDEAIRSCGIAAQTLMLAAKAMGLDSNPMIGFDPVPVAEIINLPSDHVIGFMIAVGKAVKPAMPKGGQLALPELVVQDRFE